MNYIGEHLGPGQIGRAFIILSFLASALAVFAYYRSERAKSSPEGSSWRNIGRWAFASHGVSVFGFAFCMFYVMTYKYYEYQYAQQHVSDELPFKYIFAAFWEGQEGSFTLWMFWHAILGVMVMWRSKQWEAPVLTTLAAIQVVLGSMVLGAYFDLGFMEFRLGSNPLLLLRDVMDAPIFSKEDYVKLIKGNGLNPLLQNYWMTIHPPTLFLGFASTSIPFCYAVAALWRNEHRSWLKEVLPWALFSGAILGTGILMGGAWAYEALSFGGYWAWDPVENMSLVPWLIMIAGIHTNLIARNTDNAIRSTYLYYILSFILIVYSTFLTRSGILGDTSVHAFTEMGLEWQLVFFIVAFTILGFGLYFYRSKSIPTVEKEEALMSREFWLFMGSLVLLFSSILITFTTSIPVYNKISEAFGKPLQLSPPIDVVAHYNNSQLWIGVFMALLSGVTQFLRYRESNFQAYAKKIITHLGISALVAGILTYAATQWIEARAWQYLLLLFTSIFTAVSNFDYIVSFLKNNLKAAGASLAHIGFGLMIVGVLASGLNKMFISNNPFAQEGLVEGEDKEFYKKNILLLKDSPMFMSGYEVTYTKDTMWDFTRQFTVHYRRRDMKTTQVIEEFDLQPNVLYDKTFTKIAASNPSTKHYWNKDIFTHVSSLPKADTDAEFRKQQEDSIKYFRYDALVNDTIFTKGHYAIIQNVTLNPTHKDYKREPNDIAIGLRVAVRSLESDSTWYANPLILLRDKELLTIPDVISALKVKVRVPQNIFEQVLVPDAELKYKTYELVPGNTVEIDGAKVTFSGFDKNGSHPNFEKQASDIAVNAVLSVQEGNRKAELRPLFVIRNDSPMGMKDESLALGVHARFLKIDPQTGAATLGLARSNAKARQIPVEIAENVGRNDYIVLQAIVFPGINYFWIGSILMMFGLTMSWIWRLSQKKQ